MEPDYPDFDIPEMSDFDYRICLTWWEVGGHPGWRRVWDDGRDVTDEDPATWPWPWRDDGRPSRSRAKRQAR